jgi:uncharacterized membrane protein
MGKANHEKYFTSRPRKWYTSNMISWWIVGLAALGFINAGYIQYKKGSPKKLQCLIGDGDCNAVVTSKYNQMFGIPNEILGMLFYASVIALVLINNFVTQSITFVVEPGQYTLALGLALFIIESGALVVSIVLTVIQAVVLKEWCEYCILSAVINLIMWVITLFFIF